MHGAVSVVFFLLSMIFFKVLFSDLFHALTNRLKKAAENIVSKPQRMFKSSTKRCLILLFYYGFWIGGIYSEVLFWKFIPKHIQRFADDLLRSSWYFWILFGSSLNSVLPSRKNSYANAMPGLEIQALRDIKIFQSFTEPNLIMK